MYFDISFSNEKLYAFVSNFHFDFTLNKKKEIYSPIGDEIKSFTNYNHYKDYNEKIFFL
jgi:hypothetical protein